MIFYSLLPYEYIHDSEIIPSTLFAGTGITTVRGTIGTVASVAAYTNTTPTAINLHSDSTSTPHQIRAGIQSTSVATDIGINLVAVGANLDQLTQGVVDIWLYTSFITP